MNSISTLRQRREHCVAHGTRLSAHWAPVIQMAPDTTGTRTPGDGVSQRETEAGHWGSTAAEDAAPDDTVSDTVDEADGDRRRAPGHRVDPLKPAPSVDIDEESMTDDTALVGDPDGTQKMHPAQPQAYGLVVAPRSTASITRSRLPLQSLSICGSV
jgi:hypothetical protein